MSKDPGTVTLLAAPRVLTFFVSRSCHCSGTRGLTEIWEYLEE
jgi:hypothetical protein